MEIADLVVINKADIDPRAAAFARSQMKSALNMVRHASPNWLPPVLTLSALQKQGVTDFWQEVQRFHHIMTQSGELATKRRQQARAWMWELIDSGLRQRFRHHPKIAARLSEVERAVEAGHASSSAAAFGLLEALDQPL
jgi:LAO/AO transport system kinase